MLPNGSGGRRTLPPGRLGDLGGGPASGMMQRFQDRTVQSFLQPKRVLHNAKTRRCEINVFFGGFLGSLPGYFSGR